MPSCSARRVVALATAVGALAAAGVTPTAQAATSSGCEGGGYAVTLPSGKVLAAGVGGKFSAAQLAGGLLHVQGRYTQFDVDPAKLDVYDYALTGAANQHDMTRGVFTPIWASKIAALGGMTLDRDVEIKPYDSTGSGLAIQGVGRALKMRVQAKDCATGGVFQIEGERADGQPLVYTHRLASNVFFYRNPVTGKINIGNGDLLVAKDSPMGASGKVTEDGVSTWTVQPGGRMGFVLGEDAVEASTPSSCTQQCQAQTRVRGTIDVPADAMPGGGA